MPAANRGKVNSGQRLYHPHAMWVQQAAAFHSGPITPAIRAIHWPAHSDFSSFFRDLTGDSGLAIAQERISFARYYTVSALVEYDHEGAEPLAWSELSLPARLNIIAGLEEIEAMAKYLQTDGEANPEDWEEVDRGAENARITLQYSQNHLKQAQNWWEFNQHLRAPRTIVKTFTAVPPSTTVQPSAVLQPSTAVQPSTGKSSADIGPKYNWDDEEIVWCRAYAKDKKVRFVDRRVSDTETNVDWTIWHCHSSDESKCSASVKQMQIDHHEHFKGRVFSRHTKGIGRNFDPRPSGKEPHRSCLSIWKKLVAGTKKGDLIFCETLRDINFKYSNLAVNAAAAVANAQAGTNLVPVPVADADADADEGDSAPKPQVSTKTTVDNLGGSLGSVAGFSSDVEQQTTPAHRDQGENNVLGYRAIGGEVSAMEPTPVDPSEPARRYVEIEEDYDAGMEDDE